MTSQLERGEVIIPEFGGELIQPGDAQYDEARQVFNGSIDRYPRFIARCGHITDIPRALRFAIDGGHQIAVRGGGHSVAGHALCDDGVVIDLSKLRGVEVDAQRRIAYVEPGATWRDVDAATSAFGLATPGGVISTTGVAGFTLGGGLGWLSRRFGLTCDNLIGAELLTPDGQVIWASNETNSDILWALRGGGGNFGIVTRFKYQLHEVPEVIGGFVAYDAADAESVIEHYRSVMDTADDELAAILDFAPTADGSSRSLITIIACCSRTDDAGSAQVQRLLTVPATGGCPVTPPKIRKCGYAMWQRVLDHTAPDGRLNYWKSAFLPNLSSEAAVTVSELARTQPSEASRIHLIRMGGDASRQEPDATAFSARYHPYVVHLITAWTSRIDTERCVAWAKGACARLRPYSAPGAYLNFIGDEGQGQVRSSFGVDSYERLVQLKTEVDPANRLCLNQNIMPRTFL